MLLSVVDFATGITFVVLGVVSWVRSRWLATMAVCAGAAWFLGDVVPAVTLLHRPLVVHVAIIAAVGGLGGPIAAVVVPVLWVTAMPVLGVSPWGSWVAAAGAAFAAWRLPSGPSAVSRRAARGALVAVALALSLPVVVRSAWAPAGQPAALGIYTVLMLAAGALLVAGEIRSGTREAQHLIELADRTPAETLAQLEALLASTRPSSRRRVLERMVRLLQANAELQTHLEERIAEVGESRARLVSTAAEERRRLEQSLMHGAIPYLEELAHVIPELASEGSEQTRQLAARCLDEAGAAKDDLTELARGLHPRTVTEQGLGSALAELADHTAVPIQVEAPSGRFAEPVETALWYACSEAVTNLVKHAQASTGALILEVDGNRLRARIRDDGVGGARMEWGGGLAGLRDRLAAVDGEVRVLSPPGGGTEVVIEVPVS